MPCTLHPRATFWHWHHTTGVPKKVRRNKLKNHGDERNAFSPLKDRVPRSRSHREQTNLGSPAKADAVAFGQWRADRRLIERGARANLWQAAALGLMDRVRQFFEYGAPSPAAEITKAFWCACHGGQRESAAYLLERGADINWVGFDELTPLDAARRSGAADVARWLEGLVAKSTQRS